MKNKYEERYLQNNPWAKTLNKIRSRCNYKKHLNYKYYGGKGIKCLISISELKKLWIRDKAYEMKEPSIDRKQSKGHYTFDNCQYIEMEVNRKKQDYMAQWNDKRRKEHSKIMTLAYKRKAICSKFSQPARVPSIEEMSEVTVDLIEEFFPKGECSERGSAIVLHAKMLIALHDLWERGKT